MDPVLAWIVCAISAFLLAAGGYLLARSIGARKMARSLTYASQLKDDLAQVHEERRRLLGRCQELEHEASELRRQTVSRLGAVTGSLEIKPAPVGLGGDTLLPMPTPFFEATAPRGRPAPESSAPRMRVVGEGEYEITDAASQSRDEWRRQAAEEEDLWLDRPPEEQTRKFQLNTPEAAVHFLQRIDELEEENRALRAKIDDGAEALRALQATGSEHAQRTYALDATAEKLRQELRRRDQRIQQLESRLGQQYAAGQISDDGFLHEAPDPTRQVELPAELRHQAVPTNPSIRLPAASGQPTIPSLKTAAGGRSPSSSAAPPPFGGEAMATPTLQVGRLESRLFTEDPESEVTDPEVARPPRSDPGRTVRAKGTGRPGSGSKK